jgi:hypothetical protein
MDGIIKKNRIKKKDTKIGIVLKSVQFCMIAHRKIVSTESVVDFFTGFHYNMTTKMIVAVEVKATK